MKLKVSEDLLGKPGTISFDNQLILTEVKKITSDYTALKIFSSDELKVFQKEQVCRLMVETNEDQSIHLFSVKVESIHKFDDEMFVFVKPLTASKEVNKRTGHRLSTSHYFGKTIVSQYRSFPPIDKNWQRGDVVNVSEGGVQLIGKEYFSKGQFIELFLKAPILQEDEIILTKVVNICTNERGYSYSLEFLNLSTKQIEHLKDFIKKGVRQV